MLLKRLCRLQSLVVRNGAIHVVGHMRGTNAMVDEVEHGSIRTIDGHEGAAAPVPSIVVEVRHVNVGVLEPRVQHQPCVADRQGAHIHGNHGGPAERFAPEEEGRERGDDADVGLQDLVLEPAREELLLALVEGLPGPHVAGPAVGGAARGTEEDVGGPAEKQPHGRAHDRDGRSGAQGLGSLLPDARLAPHLGHVRLALSQVVRLRVVDRVGALPGLVGRQHDRVQHVADGRLQPLLVAEGVVATLVRDDPHARGEGSLHHRVHRPEWPRRRRERDELPGQEGTQRALAHGRRRIHHRLERVLLEAVLRDFIHDLLPGRILLAGDQGLAAHAAAAQGLFELFADALLLQVDLRPTQLLNLCDHCLAGQNRRGAPQSLPALAADRRQRHRHRGTRRQRRRGAVAQEGSRGQATQGGTAAELRHLREAGLIPRELPDVALRDARAHREGGEGRRRRHVSLSLSRAHSGREAPALRTVRGSEAA
mmetsp:Transcript_162808/g.517247  ORF Transcript_162808/g.517247 Transcript_162808/m.517247 type:complete len:482 (+) Transcript_162808:720-2165(+)